MPWTCPACRLAIRHSEHDDTPRTGVIYRCHVCRLELVVDITEGKMTLAPFRPSTEDHPVESRRADPAGERHSRRPIRKRTPR